MSKINIKKTLGIMLVGVIAFAAYYESNIAYDYLKKMSVAIEVYESIILEYENAAEVDELKMNELKGQLAEIDPRTAVYKASMGFSSTLGLLAVLFAVITWFRRSEKT
ncbi:hypothetical protein [Alishewanella longhuensis]|uniref:hypothetical protein n=1 Tax=Alishewanella longhuensis TaxID=1091037 RepID=UPI001674EEBF|nr:hypothetical protein [Alishewanella longhuensis]